MRGPFTGDDLKGRGAVARRFLSVAALAAFALLWAPTAASAAPTWLAPTNVSDAGTNTEAPQVAVDRQGDAVAVWQYADGGNFVIQATTREAGGTWSAPVDLSPPGSYAYYPQVAIDAAGDAVAVWEYYDGTHWVVQATTREAGGTWSAPVELSPSGQESVEPRVAIDAEGDAVVVWEDLSDRTIRTAGRAAGSAWSSPTSLSPPGQEARGPQVALDAEGDAVAAWRGYEGGKWIIQTASSAVGGAWSTPAALSAPARSAEGAQVALDAAGGAVVVWERSEGANWSIQAAGREAGGAWSSPVELSTPGQEATESQVAVDPQGDAVAIWAHTGTIQAVGREAGGTWSSPVDLSPSGQGSPQVALDAEGDAVAVWRGYDGSNWTIWSASSAVGGAWSTPVALSVPAWSAERPQVAFDADGDAVAVWQRYDGSDEFVQAAFLDAAGPQLRGLSIPTSGTAGQALPFSVSPLDAFSAVGATSWSFGDGATAAGTAVTHAYAKAGTYTVTVTSADALGNSSTATGTVTVAAAPMTPPAGTGGPGKAGRSGKAGKDAGSTRATAGARARVKNGRALLKLTCPASGPCKGQVVLSLRVKKPAMALRARKKAPSRSVRIGAASFALAPGGNATVPVKLSAKGLALLKASGRRGLKASLGGAGVKPGPLVLKATPRRHPAHPHRH